MPLYLLLLILSVSIPFIFSFDKKVGFYQYWKRLFPAMIIVGSIFITADIFFVRNGVWGFNPDYHTDIILLGLPVEEWLFFLFIPYSCVFIHYVLFAYYPDLQLGNIFVRILSIVLITTLAVIMIINYQKSYTLFIFSVSVISLVLALIDKSRILNRFYLSYVIILVPFFIVNSILTGTFIKGEVFWYKSSEILGLRVFTVPVEDAGFAFSMILLILLLMEKFKKAPFFELKRNI